MHGTAYDKSSSKDNLSADFHLSTVKTIFYIPGRFIGA